MMTRVRAITERLRHRYATLGAQVSEGQPIDIRRMADQAAIEIVEAGCAALLDALERTEAADGNAAEQLDPQQPGS